jgi:hypothetical protein
MTLLAWLVAASPLLACAGWILWHRKARSAPERESTTTPEQHGRLAESSFVARRIAGTITATAYQEAMAEFAQRDAVTNPVVVPPESDAR